MSEDRAWMTPLLNRIADVAGERAAILIGKEKAGQQISIPRRARAGDWLSGLVGLEAAQKLAGAFGNQKLTIPVALAGQKRQRAQIIADLSNKGYSLNRIAQMTGLSRATVRSHVEKLDRPSPQGTLF